MTLQEIRNINKEYQMVLSFSNNNDVVIEEEDFDPNSKFVRRSKIRLDMNFEEIQNDSGMMIFRTYRGKNDYIVYLAAEYKIVEAYRKKVSHSQTIKSSENKQMTLKDIIKPNKDNVLHGYITVNSNQFYWSINHPDLKHWRSSDYVIDKTQPTWFTSFMAVYKMLSILSREDQCMHYKQVIVHLHENNKALAKLASGKWEAHNHYTKWYVESIKELRKIFQSNHVSLVFKLDQIYI